MKNIIILVVLALIGFGAYRLLIKKDATTTMAPTETGNPYATPPQENPIVNPTTVPATPPAPTPKPVVTPTPQPTPTPTPPPAPTEVTVDIKNYNFNPSPITVKVGTKVTWINGDSVGHTVTSDTDGLLSSGTLSNGGKYSFTFTTPGTTNYHCVPHPNMKGTVVVTN